MNLDNSLFIEDLSTSQFWSIALGMDIPEGPFFPEPKSTTEIARPPIAIPKAVFASLFDYKEEKADHALLHGASIALRGYHRKMCGLDIPWCIEKSVPSIAQSYQKAEVLRLYWYCPWKSCRVTKSWFVMDLENFRYKKKRERCVKEENKIKNAYLKHIASNQNAFETEQCYVVVEILGDFVEHEHLKGTKGGIRINCADSLKHLRAVKEHLNARVSVMQGNYLDILKRETAPIVKMAQALINQPAEAFIGGFTDIVPHRLACYQKDNQKIKQKLQSQFGITPTDSLLAAR